MAAGDIYYIHWSLLIYMDPLCTHPYPLLAESMYTFGAPAVSRPPMPDLNSPDHCFPGLRTYTEPESKKETRRQRRGNIHSMYGNIQRRLSGTLVTVGRPPANGLEEFISYNRPWLLFQPPRMSSPTRHVDPTRRIRAKVEVISSARAQVHELKSDRGNGL